MRLFTGFALKQLLLEFPFLFGGTFIEALNRVAQAVHLITFPFLFGGTFIEAPVFTKWPTLHGVFPFLFGGTFIEASQAHENSSRELMAFPFLFGGTFIEAAGKDSVELRSADFPSFSEGLSLRPVLQDEAGQWMVTISLPFRRDFH